VTNRSARIFIRDNFAGLLEQNPDGDYLFRYDTEYLKQPDAASISLTLPLSTETYISRVLFPFFDGLIPEGWLLDLAVENWKLNSRDRMALLLATCRDCIGAVHVEEVTAVTEAL